jgi:hypothetical protein
MSECTEKNIYAGGNGHHLPLAYFNPIKILDTKKAKPHFYP